jgi:gliding motility-associated-like protein
MKSFYLVLFTLLLGFQASAQLDTLFWFVAPEIAQSHGDRPIVFRFATLATPATITVSQPANPGFPPQVINLGANAAQTLDLTPWIDIIENKPANSVLNYGFKIKATAPIMAYYEVVTSCNCNPDIFTLKGKNALGTNFIVSAQTFLNNANYARSGFDIVATQNNTSITIVPSSDILGHLAGVPFTIVLNMGETYSAEASNTAGNLHLSGSTVISDKPIAITLKDDSMSGAPYGGCADLMGDQTIPVPVTGKEYVTLKGYLNGPDKVYVVATQNNTQLTIDGVNVGTFNTTNLYVHTQSNPTAYIQADKPVYVLHTTGFGCEVGGAIVPPVVCTGSNTVAFVRSTNEFFAMNILVPAGGENTFTLNGSPANVGPGIFQPVPGTNNNWMYAQLDGSGFIGVQAASRIENASSKFHLGVIHGGANSGCRYGYFSDFAAYKYEIEAANDLLCSGDTLMLTTDSLPGATYNWTGPLGINSNGASLTLYGVVPAQSGNYIISGYNPGACELIPDTVAITIISTPNTPLINTNSPLCLGDTLLAETTLNGAFTYHWNFNNDTVAVNDSLTIQGLQPGYYPIELYSNLGACISPTAVDTIHVLSAPQISHQGPIEVCGPTINFTSATQTDPSDPVQSITWYNQQGILGNSGNLNNVNASAGAYSVETYWVALLTANNCFSSDTFNITFHPIPSVSLSVNPLCDGESAQFSSQLTWISNPPPTPTVVYGLNFGDGQNAALSNASHSYDSTGTYQVILTVASDEGCTNADTVNVTIVAIPTITPFVQTACGQQGTFDVGLSLGNYTFNQLTWNIPGVGDFSFPSFTHTFINPGAYIASITLEGSNGCDFSETLPFTILPSVTIDNLNIPNVITPNEDLLNDQLILDNLFVDCTNFDLIIINRWGNVVYEMNNTSTPFSGKDLNGKDLEAGVYFYKLTTNDNKVVSGHITVIR